MPLCRESSFNEVRHQKSFACCSRVTQILKERQNNQGGKRFAFLSFFLFRENGIREEKKLNPLFILIRLIKYERMSLFGINTRNVEEARYMCIVKCLLP